jgi:hypothetical protein
MNSIKQLISAQESLMLDLVLEHVPPKVTDEMNLQLTRPYLARKVEQALQEMRPNKVLGLDSFTARFCQLH